MDNREALVAERDLLHARMEELLAECAELEAERESVEEAHARWEHALADRGMEWTVVEAVSAQVRREMRPVDLDSAAPERKDDEC